MDESDLVPELQAFVVRELLAGAAGDLGPDTPLLSLGIIDSLGVAQLVAFVADQFGVEIPSRDIVPENLATLRALGALVHRLRSRKDVG